MGVKLPSDLSGVEKREDNEEGTLQRRWWNVIICGYHTFLLLIIKLRSVPFMTLGDVCDEGETKESQCLMIQISWLFDDTHHHNKRAKTRATCMTRSRFHSRVARSRWSTALDYVFFNLTVVAFVAHSECEESFWWFWWWFMSLCLRQSLALHIWAILVTAARKKNKKETQTRVRWRRKERRRMEEEGSTLYTTAKGDFVLW